VDLCENFVSLCVSFFKSVTQSYTEKAQSATELLE
jgi:hypothetical protein